MSGTKSKKKTEVILERLESLLRRDEPLNAFKQIASGLQQGGAAGGDFSRYAICLDSNVLLNLSKKKGFEDVLDYFSTKHEIKLIISAQTLQEFWNNHIFAVETIASSLENKFTALEKDVLKIDADFGEFADKFRDLINQFKSDYGHLHDKNIRANLTSLIKKLMSTASVYEVPRTRFHKYAATRQSLKTPPGFKDTGDGDYFIWIDYLFALLLLKGNGRKIDKAIIVTDDKKSDWSKGGIPHPVLSAEVETCIGVPFETWSLDKFIDSVQTQINSI